MNRNTLIGLGAGAAVGLVGGAVLNNVINGDNGGGIDMSGFANALPNMDNNGGGGGLLNGMFDNNGGDGSGSGIFQGFGSNGGDGSSYIDPSGQGNSPDWSGLNSQGQSSSSDQTQYTYQSGGSGPNLGHLAGQAWSQFKKYKQHQQQAAASSQHPSQPNSALPVQHVVPQNADPGYQAAHSAYYSGAQQPQSQASYQGHPQQVGHQSQQSQSGAPGYGQAPGSSQGYGPGQSYQPPSQSQGLNINKTHVKQFAKGAMLAGGLLAKLNGVNIGGPTNSVNPLGGN